MIIKTMWGMRKGEQTPELMVAWDEYSVDGYTEGFEVECRRARESWENDLETYRMVDITVPRQSIKAAFLPGAASGVVLPAGHEGMCKP